MNDELYLYEKETLIYLYDILELDDEYAFLDSVLPSSFEQDSIFIMEIIDRESGKKYYYDVSICNSNKLEVEEFNNPANRILENKDLINIERIRKQNYFPVVMLHSMLFEKDETVQFMILDAKGMVCSGKYR